MLAISRAEIRQAVTMRDAIDAARAAFRALTNGQAVVPPRPHVTTANGTSLFMPAYKQSGDTVGLKLVTVTPENPRRGLPTVQAVVLLVDESTGTPAAILEGTFLTQLRTGAAMGLAADLLARPDAQTVALFGVGATAQTSLWAVCSVRDVGEVRVVHPHAERFPGFATAMREHLGAACPPLRRVESPAEAIQRADVVLTATTSAAPVFPGEALAPGTFVGALGAYAPKMRELDTITILRSHLVVDTRGGALREAGDVVIPIEEGTLSSDDIWAELGEIASGTRPGRTKADEIFVFKSVGNAMQDLTLATRIYELARARSLGTEVPL
jgi:ornithine cyclodeaminase/alanine dehydrogenase-like protein (mu-crystallin family)